MSTGPADGPWTSYPPLTIDQAVAGNLAEVRSRIEAAAKRAGRDPSTITVVAVSKTFGADRVRAAWLAGQRDFGENKVQEAEQKIAATGDLGGARWHLIGHLQSNKARKAAAPFAMIHSIDSPELLRRVDAAAVEQGTTPEILIQADLAGEATKHGAAADALESLVRDAAGARAVKLAGLMILPPWNDNPEVT